MECCCIMHVDSTTAINWTKKKKAKVSRGRVSSMTRRGVEPCSPAVMFQEWQAGVLCTYPIYYQRVVCVDKGSVIIRYKQNKLTCRKRFLRGGEPRSPAAMFQAWLGRVVEPCSPAAMLQAWQADVLVRYTTRELSVKKRSVIIQHKLPELIKKSFLGREPLSCNHVSSMTRRGVEPCLKFPQPCFKRDRRMYLSDILPGSCQSWKRKYDNSMEITWAYQKSFWTLLSRSHVSSMTRAGSRTLPSRSHISSMTGGWTCPMYYQGVVSRKRKYENWLSLSKKFLWSNEDFPCEPSRETDCPTNPHLKVSGIFGHGALSWLQIDRLGKL